MWHIREAGKLDCRQERKKLLAPTFKCSFLKGNKHGTDQVLAGGWLLGRDHRSYIQLNYFGLQEKQQEQRRENCHCNPCAGFRAGRTRGRTPGQGQL